MKNMPDILDDKLWAAYIERPGDGWEPFLISKDLDYISATAKNLALTVERRVLIVPVQVLQSETTAFCFDPKENKS